MLLRRRKDKINNGYFYFFWCPACNQEHHYHVVPDGWTFNGNWDSPSFSPSLRLDNCHLFVTDGKIDYCNDCKHHLNGKSQVKMVDIPGL